MAKGSSEAQYYVEDQQELLPQKESVQSVPLFELAAYTTALSF
jgi:hypothetical protein